MLGYIVRLTYQDSPQETNQIPTIINISVTSYESWLPVCSHNISYICMTLSMSQYSAITIIMIAATCIALRYHTLLRDAYTIGNASPTMTSCHHSIPRLNARRDEMNLSDGISISRSSPANPSPWNNPKKNIAIILDLLPHRNTLSHKNTEVKATQAIERAIIGSTILELNTSAHVPASIRVILCARVNTLVSLKISFHDINTKRSDRINNI